MYDSYRLRRMNQLSLLILSLTLSLVACDNKNASVDNVGDVFTQSKTLSKKQPLLTPKKIKYVYNKVPKNMTVQEKKKRFRALLVPAVHKVYTDLDLQHRKVTELIKSGEQPELVTKLKQSYKAKSDKELLRKLKPHPVSIVLAQAAMESAWATSRFFTEAKNVFGVWSYDKNEPRIAAKEKRGKKTIWLKKYATIEDSIRDNYRVLARGSAYVDFRKHRVKSKDPYLLVDYLDEYSELGDEYGDELADVIRFNKFTKLDF